ncbi:MAG: pilus assembly protein PilM [Candidatus Berkelbacteria bacterium]
MFDTKLSQPILGLDIGQKTMKIVQIQGSGRNTQIVGAAEIEIPINAITKDGVKDKEKIAEILKQTVSNPKNNFTTKYISSALPESLVFTETILVNKVSNKELAKNISLEASKFCPIPAGETYLDWQITNDAPNNMLEVLVVAAPKILVDSLVETIELAGLEPIGLETKPLAYCRALLSTKEKGPLIIVDIGAQGTNLTCFDTGVIKYTSIVTIGGDRITEYMTTGSQALIDEINHLMKYYENKTGKLQIFKKIILTGGGANIPELRGIIENDTRIQTVTGTPQFKIKNFDPKFSVALGLAMKEI